MTNDIVGVANDKVGVNNDIVGVTNDIVVGVAIEMAIVIQEVKIQTVQVVGDPPAPQIIPAGHDEHIVAPASENCVSMWGVVVG